ncbi:MAG: 50S ribosomal protein L13 [Myxococcota bacterium]
MKSFWAKKEKVSREWLLVDVQNQILGRAASRIALILRGKHKPTFTPNVDTGDFVVVVNAEKIKATGNKEEGKIYYKYTGYVGHLKKRTLKEQRERHPEEILRLAVKRMLPRGPLGNKMLKKLKIYRGSEHPHKAQMPKEFDLKSLNR